MKAIQFPEVNIEIAKDQEEYETLPSHIRMASPGREVVSCFELSKEELEKVQKTGKIWMSQMTFGSKLQPYLISVNKQDAIPGAKDEGD